MIDLDLNQKKILIIRPDAVGDCINLLPLINTIKKKWPASVIYLLVSEYTVPLFEKQKSIDYISIDVLKKGKNIFNFYKFYKWLKKEKFYAVFHSFNAVSYSMLSWLSQIPVRVGDKNKIGPNIFHTFKVKQRYDDLTHHEVELNVDLLKPFNVDEIEYSFYLNVPDNSEIKTDLLSLKEDKRTKICIHTGSGGGNKPWSLDGYITLVKRIIKESLEQIVIIGSKSKEIEDAERISNIGKNRITNLTGMTDIKELMWVINNCDVFIGVDSGPMHIASALEKPVVCIQPTNFVKPTRWGPFGTNNIIIRPDDICRMPCFPYKCTCNCCTESISAEKVFDACKTLLSEKNKNTHYENLVRWLKPSLNILLILNDPKKEELFVKTFNTLVRDNWSCIALTQKEGYNFYKLYNVIIDNDINLIHYFSRAPRFLTSILLLLTALKQYLPPKLYIDRGEEFSSASELIKEYIKVLKT